VCGLLPSSVAGCCKAAKVRLRLPLLQSLAAPGLLRIITLLIILEDYETDPSSHTILTSLPWHYPFIVLRRAAREQPDPTFFDTEAEYFLTSITPHRGTQAGGTRVVLTGGGFNVNFFTAGNYVYIGDGDDQVPCDVIEGACSVQCGGPNTLVCDTGAWTREESPRKGSGWLDVTVYGKLCDR
jgi:hypothetical protein